jgi:2-octaprenyl-6-methoxyphenol hydroxylase
VAGRSRLLQARLLVAADGGDSGVRRRLGLGVRERGYGYDAIISTVTPEQPRAGTAFERFTDSGPLAMLPMTGGRYSVVWTARESETADILGLDDDRFAAALQQRFGHRLGRLGRPGRRIAYPLRLMLAKQLTQARLVLIGNAAHTLHPVAGQGFNLGLRDVAELADLLDDAQRTGQDPGGDTVVNGYRKRRIATNSPARALTDTLARLFVNPWAPVRIGRNLGMLGLDLLPQARHCCPTLHGHRRAPVATRARVAVKKSPVARVQVSTQAPGPSTVSRRRRGIPPDTRPNEPRDSKLETSCQDDPFTDD